MFAAENIFYQVSAIKFPMSKDVVKSRAITWNHVKSQCFSIFPGKIPVSHGTCLNHDDPSASLGVTSAEFAGKCHAWNNVFPIFFFFKSQSLPSASELQPLRVCRGREHPKAGFRARARSWRGTRGAPKSTIVGTKESTKKHGFLHEGKHQTSPFFARRKTLK